MLDLVNFGCFPPSRCQRFHWNAMRKAIKVHKNWHTIQQNEHTPGNVVVSRWIIPLITIPLLDFVMIHWTQQIQRKTFSENSIDWWGLTVPQSQNSYKIKNASWFFLYGYFQTIATQYMYCIFHLGNYLSKNHALHYKASVFGIFVSR